MSFLSIFTAMASSLNLLPLQMGQACSDWNLVNSSLIHLLSVSLNLLIRFGMIPSKTFFDLKTLVPSLYTISIFSSLDPYKRESCIFLFNLLNEVSKSNP